MIPFRKVRRMNYLYSSVQRIIVYHIRLLFAITFSEISEKNLKRRAFFVRNNSSKHGHFIFCAYRRLKDGTILYAKDYGLKAWRIWVDD